MMGEEDFLVMGRSDCGTMLECNTSSLSILISPSITSLGRCDWLMTSLYSFLFDVFLWWHKHVTEQSSKMMTIMQQVVHKFHFSHCE